MATNTLRFCENFKRNRCVETTDAGFDGKILAHHAKAGYDYPTIRLPFTFSGLIGLPTRICQTVHDGALAFIVVVSSASENSADKHENSFSSADARRLHTAEVAGSNPAEPIIFIFIWLKLSLEKRSDFNSLISDSKAQRR